MKKLIGLVIVSSALALASGARAHCGSCGVGEEKGAKAAAGHKEGHKDGHTCPLHDCCPSAIEGAQTKVTNTADGVTIVVSAKDAAAVKKIQDAGAKLGAGGHEHKHEKGHDHAPKKDAKKKS